jgi:hypothetical protein
MSETIDRNLFDASTCEGVAIGSCVMLVDNMIVYAGPLKKAPSSEGKLVLLHPDDFAKLKTHVDKRRH